QLLALLTEMGAEDDRATSLKKGHLVEFVAEAAAERSWAPAALSWDRAPAVDEEEADEAEAMADAEGVVEDEPVAVDPAQEAEAPPLAA
ncbi:MAG: chromosome partitioning protein ParB, partial [Proteobacteria bacterium]|nr:chromosome partitioning protein ParB [Pseudomonadota bacterium]